MTKKTFEMEWAGEKLVAEFNDLAGQSNGSVMVRYGETVVLATATMGREKTGIDYFPLTVDFEEKFYASGQILGNQYSRREGKSDEAIIKGRIIDRTIRPLFDANIRNEVQVVVSVLAIGAYDPDIPALIATSLALSTSDIPWGGPIGAVCLTRAKGSDQLECNPTIDHRFEKDTDLELICCGKEGEITMIEVEADEIEEGAMGEALSQALTAIHEIEDFQQEIIAQIGKVKKEFTAPRLTDEALALFKETVEPKLDGAIFSNASKKGIDELCQEWLGLFEEKFGKKDVFIADSYFEDRVNRVIHEEAVLHGRRPDGRALDELRPLFAQAGGVSEALHGSGIFYRGGTHIFTALTLDSLQRGLILETPRGEKIKHFFHHYNFPPFSAGETGKMSGPNRRMIGHGALAEKALRSVIPATEVFPYTIRLVSESLASNGSTSMGSVCASTLALMDGGVPIKKAVAGIAIGLMLLKEDSYVLLTDIQGPEDHHGDMDFKVAGTDTGITAIQLDIKLHGVPLPILKEALQKAKTARSTILATLTNAIAVPRKNTRLSHR